MSKISRRGISSIIGTMFVVLLTVAALGATISVVQQQQRATNEVAQETSRYLESLSERIEILQTRVNNNRLNLTLSNAGDTVASVKSIYIVNETASPKEQYRYDVDLPVDGRSAVTNVGQALPFIASDAISYTVRVVTESGNSDSSVYYPFILTPLPLSLSIIPPVVTTGENVSLLYTITNNLTSLEPLTVSPTINHSVQCEGGQQCTATKITSGPSEVVIEKGSFVIIKETYRIDGPPNTIVTFNASFAEAEPGNYITEEAKVIIVSSTFGVSDTIATSPDIYLILPGPFGDVSESSNNKALWGVTIVNPTDSSIQVSRVLMTVFTAAHTGDYVIEEGCTVGNGEISMINPTTGWDCPHRNQVQWKNLGNPETLGASQSMSFLARVEPGELAVSEEPGATVTATVYTDIGIFTKAGYTTAMRDANAPLGNVYLTDTTARSAENNDHMFGHLNSITNGTTWTFYVAMADLDRTESTYIETGAKLIINVPPGFSDVTVTSWTNFVDEPTVTIRADGVTQIIAVTSTALGDGDGSGGEPENDEEAEVIAFTATTPNPNEDSTYIMYAFIQGETNGATPISIGALAEIPLQVNGTS